MAILEKIIGGSLASPITAIGNVLDKIFTSDEEKLDKKAILAKIALEPQIAQTEINKIEASHRSIFVAGWRPAIGWTCALGLLYDFIIRPIANGFGLDFPSIDTSSLNSLIIALLGLGTLRTAEKFGNKSK